MVKHENVSTQHIAVARAHEANDMEKTKVEQAEGDMRGDTFGLINVGAICWFNSLIQSLMSIPLFVLTVSSESKSAPEDSVLAAFGQFLLASTRLRNTSVILIPLVREVPDFGRRQEDAHEGFHLLLDKMSPRIEALFESLWRVDLYCDLCKCIVSRASGLEKAIQVIMERDFIPVDITGDPFEQFLSGHMTFLVDYKCPRCGTIGKAMRIARLVKPPNVLVVSFNKYMGKWSSVQYGENIEVKYMSSDDAARYILMAVIQHSGNMHGGHYRTMGMRSSGLFGFDDAAVTPKTAWEPGIEDYMLFYARK